MVKITVKELIDKLNNSNIEYFQYFVMFFQEDNLLVMVAYDWNKGKRLRLEVISELTELNQDSFLDIDVDDGFIFRPVIGIELSYDNNLELSI